MRFGQHIALRKWLLTGAIFILLMIVLLPSRSRPYEFTRFAMGTVVEYTIMAPDHETGRSAMQVAHREIERVEHLFWEKDTASEVYRFNRSSRGIQTTKEVHQAITRALAYSRKTRGAFDIAIKPANDLYDFDDPSPVPPSDEAIQRALANVGYRLVETSSSDDGRSWFITKTVGEAGLVTGGFAKGYAVDRAAQALKGIGIRNALVNAGGDIVCLGRKNGKPWTVGIRHPRKDGAMIRILALSDRAVATSGDYQKYFMAGGTRYHHVLDPGTGQPSRQAQSVTVIAPTAEAADVWATALMVMGVDEGMPAAQAFSDIHVCMVDSAGTVHVSDGFGKFTASRSEALP